MPVHEIPKTAIYASDKLYLRPCEPTDAAAMAEAGNDADIAKFMSARFPSPYTLADGHQWIAHCAGSDDLHFGIFTTSSSSSGEFVGSVDLETPERDIYARTLLLGYYCGRRFRGCGFMTEAVKAATRWAFANRPEVSRIEARIFATNEASRRVLTKAGFVKEAALRLAVTKNGEQMNEEIFGLIRADLEDFSSIPVINHEEI